MGRSTHPDPRAARWQRSVVTALDDLGSLAAPVASVAWVIQVTPLYHGTEMLRQLTTGRVGATVLVHVAYLMLMTVVAFTIAMRRLERALIK
jgi:hypothetical protein